MHIIKEIRKKKNEPLKKLFFTQRKTTFLLIGIQNRILQFHREASPFTLIICIFIKNLLSYIKKNMEVLLLYVYVCTQQNVLLYLSCTWSPSLLVGGSRGRLPS